MPGLTRPALTIQAKTPEEAHGVKLFTRQRRAVVLTEMGERLFRMSRRYASIEEQIREVLTESSELARPARSRSSSRAIPTSSCRWQHALRARAAPRTAHRPRHTPRHRPPPADPCRAAVASQGSADRGQRPSVGGAPKRRFRRARGPADGVARRGVEHCAASCRRRWRDQVSGHASYRSWAAARRFAKPSAPGWVSASSGKSKPRARRVLERLQFATRPLPARIMSPASRANRYGGRSRRSFPSRQEFQIAGRGFPEVRKTR